MNILLVYPPHPETFWSFKYALKFIRRKSAFPPLGLLTIAAMLPRPWKVKLVDMNVDKLQKKDLQWADYVFISAISIQRQSVLAVIEQCRQAGVKIVAGGPLFTTSPTDFQNVDHFILNEAEITFPQFLQDLQKGKAKPVYASDRLADLSQTPSPRWELIANKNYGSMSVQYSRGCPFNCDFCDITLLLGQKARVKSQHQIIEELDRLYAHHWRGPVFFVDDNFIGNKQKLKKDILPAIIAWMEEHKYPFEFLTQASINLADDDELLHLMVKAGFDTVFIGIESPHEESLAECLKSQNTRRNLLESIQKCQSAGLQVQGGFIVGFDSDPATIFDQHIRFIQQSGITTAMVGILNALKGTRLFQRLEKEHRLLEASTGNNTDCSINFVPKMDRQVLLDGYKKIVRQIYAPASYYQRIRTFLMHFHRPGLRPIKVRWNHLAALFRSMIRLGILGKERFHYWRLLHWTLFHKPRTLPLAVTLAIHGFHFRKVFNGMTT